MAEMFYNKSQDVKETLIDAEIYEDEVTEVIRNQIVEIHADNLTHSISIAIFSPWRKE